MRSFSILSCMTADYISSCIRMFSISDKICFANNLKLPLLLLSSRKYQIKKAGWNKRIYCLLHEKTRIGVRIFRLLHEKVQAERAKTINERSLLLDT